jgi:hypothetical protein
MESWSVGFDGDEDVERHAAIGEGEAELGPLERPRLRVRAVSDYI